MSSKTNLVSRASARVARGRSAATTRLSGSAAEHVWQRLDEMDFLNRGILFAGVLLLSLVPFMIVLAALTDRDAAARVAARFGLSQAAAHDVTQVFTSPSNTSNAIQGLSYVFVVLGGLTAVSSVQDLYEHAFEVPNRGIRDTPRRIACLAFALGAGALAGWVSPALSRTGGPALLAAVGLVALVVAWWFGMWLLVGGRIRWRDLLPSALATGVCWLGMTIVFRITMSNTITEDYKKYGDIGVIFALMTFLIAVGVVIIIGAVVGVVWRERHRRC